MKLEGRTGRPPHDDVLTPSEWRVVDGVRHGLSNPDIARRLGVTTDAVKFHVSNALGKLGLSRRTELRLWQGIRKDSVMAAEPTGEPGSGLGPIGQIARVVRDVDRSQAWYAETLGLPHLYTIGGFAFLDCAGTRLFLSSGDPKTNAILYFRVGNIEAEHRRLAALGVEFISAPHRIHVHADGSEEWMSFFRDPDGGTLALMCVIQPGRDRL